MTDNKHIKVTWIVTIGVFLFQFIDVFFIHSRMPLFSTNIVSRLLGIAILLGFSGALSFNLKKFCFKSYGWFFEILLGLLISVVPITIMYLSEFIYFHYRGYENLNLTFRPSGFETFDGSNEHIIGLVVYILTLLLVAVFKEIFYRGYLITQLSSKFGVPLAIFIQSIVYMLSFAPTLIYNLVTGGFEYLGPLMSVFVVCGHMVYNLICGVKWGLFYRVNGTVWMSVADHFFTDFMLTSFFFTESRLPEKWYIILVISIQILSILMFMPLFLKRDRQNEIAAAEFALSREALKMGVDNYSPSLIRKRLDKKLIAKVDDEIGHKDWGYEEAVGLRDIKMPDETSLTSSVTGFEINDSGFDYKTEISTFDSHPSEKARDYFDEMLGREKKEEFVEFEPSIDNKNAENISKLVKNFFDEDFEKHTFH